MKRMQNMLLVVAVIVLGVAPLWIVEAPSDEAGNQSAMFGGADDKARNLVSEIRPDYQPWFTPLVEPASSEIASMLFALQAALGAGFIGYYLGAARTRERLRNERKTAYESDTSGD